MKRFLIGLSIVAALCVSACATVPWNVSTTSGVANIPFYFSSGTYLATTAGRRVGVRTTSPAATLDVNGDFLTTSMYSNASGSTFFGDSLTSGLFFSSIGQVQARREGGQNAEIRLTAVGGGTDYLAFDNTGGTFASPSTTTLRIMGGIVAVGWDGVTVGSMQHSAQINLVAPYDWSATQTPGEIQMFTIPQGSRTQVNTLELIDNKVGVMTAAPLTTLDVGGTLRSTTQSAPTGGTGVEMYYDGTNGNVLAFNRTGSSWRPMHVEGSTLLLNTTNGGNVGINTTAPATMLDVSGSAQFGTLPTKSTFSATGQLSLTNLTSGRVATVGTSGLVQDDSDFTFNGTTATITGAAHTNLTVSGNSALGTVSGTAFTDSGLTSGRVATVGTGGLLQDDSDFTFNGTTATITGVAATNLSVSGTFAPATLSVTTLGVSGTSTLSTVNGSGLVTINGGGNTDQFKAKGTSESAYFHVGVFGGETYMFHNFFYNGAFSTDASTIGSSGIILGSDTIKLQNAVASATPSRADAVTITHQAVKFNNYGAGAITADASGNLTSTSDERLKDLAGPFTRGLKDVLKITPQNYKWKVSTGYDREHVYSGFIAQDVLAAIPEAVWKNKDGYYSFQDRPVMAAMLNAIKEMNATIVKLQAKVEALEKKVK